LQRLALSTADDIVAEAEANILRAHTIADRLNPTAIAQRAAPDTVHAAALCAEIAARQAAEQAAQQARQAADEAANLAAHEAEISAGYRQETEDAKRHLAQAQAAAQQATDQRVAAEAQAADTRRELDTLREDFERLATSNAACRPPPNVPIGNRRPTAPDRSCRWSTG
jgi:hypothetical protein